MLIYIMVYRIKCLKFGAKKQDTLPLPEQGQSRLSSSTVVSLVYEQYMVWCGTFCSHGYHPSGYGSSTLVWTGTDAGTQGIRALLPQI